MGSIYLYSCVRVHDEHFMVNSFLGGKKVMKTMYYIGYVLDTFLYLDSSKLRALGWKI